LPPKVEQKTKQVSSTQHAPQEENSAKLHDVISQKAVLFRGSEPYIKVEIESSLAYISERNETNGST
jgi:hypothetical protein